MRQVNIRAGQLLRFGLVSTSCDVLLQPSDIRPTRAVDVEEEVAELPWPQPMGCRGCCQPDGLLVEVYCVRREVLRHQEHEGDEDVLCLTLWSHRIAVRVNDQPWDHVRPAHAVRLPSACDLQFVDAAWKNPIGWTKEKNKTNDFVPTVFHLCTVLRSEGESSISEGLSLSKPCVATRPVSRHTDSSHGVEQTPSYTPQLTQKTKANIDSDDGAGSSPRLIGAVEDSEIDHENLTTLIG